MKKTKTPKLKAPKYKLNDKIQYRQPVYDPDYAVDVRSGTISGVQIVLHVSDKAQKTRYIVKETADLVEEHNVMRKISVKKTKKAS